MKKLKSFLALAAIFACLAAPAQAQTIFSSGGTATSTNTVVTVSPAPTSTNPGPQVLEVYNYGSSRLYVARNAVATAAFGTTIAVEPCELVRLVTTGNTTTLGLITAASTTTTYQVYGYFNRVSPSDFTYGPAPIQEQVHKEFIPGCSTLALFTSRGAALTPFALTEVITANTGAATTDSVTNLLPANSIILGVTCRVLVTIGTAASYTVGDATTAARFQVSTTNITAGQTFTGLSAMFGVVSTTATGPTQAAAAPLRITFNTTPSAGSFFCATFGFTLIAPTS